MGDEVRNVQHVCGGFIWGMPLVCPQRLFKNLIAASNSKFTQSKWQKNCLLGPPHPRNHAFPPANLTIPNLFRISSLRGKKW